MDDRIREHIRNLIDNNRWTEARSVLKGMSPAEVKGLMTDMEKTRRVFVFRLLEKQSASEVLSHLEGGERDNLLKELTDEEIRQVLKNMRPDDRTEILEVLPGKAIQKLLNLLPPEELNEARQLLGYPKESIGRLMTPDYVAVRPDWTIEQSLRHIRNMGKDSETINVIYVTNQSWKLIDALGLRQFILANPADQVQQIMDYSFVGVQAADDREKAVHVIQDYDLYALPVLDAEGTLLGIVTVDDILDVAEEETTEDIQKTAAVEPLKISYGDVGIWSLYRKRVLWLIGLFGINLLAASVIASYEKTLSSAIALAFFIPILMGTGGNVGTQSASLVIRALATREVYLKQFFRTFNRELATGLLLAVTMALAGGVFGFMNSGSDIAFTMGISIILIVMVTNTIGVVIPFLLTQLKVDPAVVSSPLIASISDVTCLIIYFSVAQSVFGIV
ncbi:MAG: magnesium transporter [Nitrospirota bacterium]